MALILAAAAACVCFVAAAFGTFVPIRDGVGVEYIFAWPGGWLLAATGAVAFALFAALDALVQIARARGQTDAPAVRRGTWLAPLTLLACVPLGIIPAIPGIGWYGAPAAYVFYDLRWWWVLVLSAWTLVRADRSTGGVLFRRFRLPSSTGAARVRLLHISLLTTVIVWAIATTPNLRFIGVLHGDEPKYIRYCEIWYQGGGADILQKVPFDAFPPNNGPRLGQTLAGLLHAAVQEASDMTGDLRSFAMSPRTFRWNRVTGDNGFVHGKHGGLYEIYQPGLSALLFPGYVLDRYLIGRRAGYNGEFPDQLPFVDSTMLLTYGACALALFQLLRRALADDRLAWIWAAIGVMTLPTAAFAFQLYPELPAALVILTVTSVVAFATDVSPWAAAAAGVAAGTLDWLHPRFLLVSGALAAAAVLRLKRGGARRSFIWAWASMLLSIMAFDYRVTGSWMPTAMWDVVNPAGPLNLTGVPVNLAGYAFDRQWGLVPHAMILAGLLPALAWLGGRARGHALLIVVLQLALSVPAAAHTLSAAGGTPGRLVLAVVPLSFWPIALLVRERWRSPAIRVATIAGVVLSLDAALAYNWSHEKRLGTIRDISVSGWKPNLMFPDLRPLSGGGTLVLLTLFATLALLCWLAVRSRKAATQNGSRGPGKPTPVWFAAAFAVLFVASAMAATALNGRWYVTDYMVDDGVARQAAEYALMDLGRCRVCFGSRTGAISWRSLAPNTASGLHLEVGVQGRRLGGRVTIDPADRSAFGRVQIDFGDGTREPWRGIVAEAPLSHVYQRAGRYTIEAWLELRDGSTRVDRASVNAQ